MKILGIIGTIFGAIAGILGGYLQFVLVPAGEIAESRWTANLDDGYYGSPQHMIDMSAMEAVTDFGAVVMIAGLLALLLSIVPAIKKHHIAWIGVGLGAIMFLLGAAHGTHMFS
jgi:ABC-type antimicrobial peptide transport system permease subunit